MMNATKTITVPTNIRISFKVLGVEVGICKATRKIVQDKAVAEVNRAINRWYYS
jgi:hypothetical protein